MNVKEEKDMMKADSRKRTMPSVEETGIEEEIRQRAYELFQARGAEHGLDLEDWLRAEEEIRSGKNEAAAA
jgi:Protein of unknown function (DUF2934)